MKLDYQAIVIGVSAGGMEALRAILKNLPGDYPLPIVIIQHMHPYSDNYLAHYLNERCRLYVKEADEKELIKAGFVYVAPPNYHLLIENDRTFSLTVTEKVNHARPSIDVTFETAAYVFGKNLIGIILTGANNDGSQGFKKIKQNGGLTIVQDPATAEVDSMPRAALAATPVDHILPLDKISHFLMNLPSRQKV